MSALTIAHIRPSDASALVGAHLDCLQIDSPAFGVLGGTFDSIIREAGDDLDMLIVFADGTVHAWN